MPWSLAGDGFCPSRPGSPAETHVPQAWPPAPIPTVATPTSLVSPLASLGTGDMLGEQMSTTPDRRRHLHSRSRTGPLLRRVVGTPDTRTGPWRRPRLRTALSAATTLTPTLGTLAIGLADQYLKPAEMLAGQSRILSMTSASIPLNVAGTMGEISSRMGRSPERTRFLQQVALLHDFDDCGFWTRSTLDNAPKYGTPLPVPDHPGLDGQEPGWSAEPHGLDEGTSSKRPSASLPGRTSHSIPTRGRSASPTTASLPSRCTVPCCGRSAATGSAPPETMEDGVAPQFRRPGRQLRRNPRPGPGHGVWPG